MWSHGSVKRAIVVGEQKQPNGFHEDDRKGVLPRFRMWKEIVLAELLNLLERGHYNLKAQR